MAPTTVRLPQSVSERITKELRHRGYVSVSTFIRTAVQNELDGRDIEHSLTSTLERFARELRRLDAAHQAEFALLDALARILLHCLPEPPTDVRDQNLAKVKERYQRLLKMAALNMQGDSRAALLELVEHGL
jgi:Arc/MetJ-type ribon-helix-helix transcriptional regulator